MNADHNPTVVADQVVVSIDYTLTIDQQVVDTTIDAEPLIYLHGYGNLIPGLEKELYGMAPGESKQIVVKPEEGYGERDPEALVQVERSEFPDDIPLQNGVELEMESKDGEMLSAVIVDLSEDTVTLDFNHPLAGQILKFDVTVLALRKPTEEELEHGHTHVEAYYDDDYVEEDDDEDDEYDDENTEEDDQDED